MTQIPGVLNEEIREAGTEEAVSVWLGRVVTNAATLETNPSLLWAGLSSPANPTGTEAAQNHAHKIMPENVCVAR